jgi:hypothetical protein
MTIKEQIIQELATKNILDCSPPQKGRYWARLKKEEKKEVKDAIFENIKRHSEGWTIKQVRTANYYRGIGLWPERLGIEYLGRVLGFSWGYFQMDEEYLLHESVQLKWDEDGVLKFDYTRTQPFDGFTPEQQTELRRLLTPTIAELLDSQFTEPIKPPRYFSFPPLYPTFGILTLLGVFITAKFRRR